MVEMYWCLPTGGLDGTQLKKLRAAVSKVRCRYRAKSETELTSKIIKIAIRRADAQDQAAILSAFDQALTALEWDGPKLRPMMLDAARLCRQEGGDCELCS